MPRIIKNTILNYLPDKFQIEETVNTLRINELNKNEIKSGYIVYLCEREIRCKDNFSLQFAMELSNKYSLPLKIIHPQTDYEYIKKQEFINSLIQQEKANFQKEGLDFVIQQGDINDYLKEYKIACLIIDFNPIIDRTYLKNSTFKVYEVDSHNIIPARFVSDKQEYSASTLRNKIYRKIYPFLSEYRNSTQIQTEADCVLNDFITNKLPYYAEYKNNPNYNVLSGLSKYLNLGFISSQRIAIEVIKSNVKRINKEEFLEELIIRKELADNFCLYCSDFKSLKCCNEWAKISLKKHQDEIREHIYSKDELENSKTFDKLWNAIQNQLREEGIIHSYLRMYWAKKIYEWSQNAEDALNTAIYLNDKYTFDSPSANGYVGILWAIAGLHDRAFKEYNITGKIRRMTYASIKRKFNTKIYIDRYKI